MGMVNWRRMKTLPVLMIVTGPPASGKTTVARRISEEFGLPLISKDDLKEIVYDAYGWGDEGSERITSSVVYELMYHFAEVQLASGKSLVMEANFRTDAADRFLDLRGRHDFQALQIRCHADRETLIGRFKDRAISGVRHPGHPDERSLRNIDRLLESGAALDIGGELIEVDTTDMASADFEGIFGHLSRMLGLDPSAESAGWRESGRGVSGPLGGAG